MPSDFPLTRWPFGALYTKKLIFEDSSDSDEELLNTASDKNCYKMDVKENPD